MTLYWTAAAVVALVASAIGLAKGSVLLPFALGATALSAVALSVLVWVGLSWFVRVDADREVFEIRRGRTLRRVDFADVVRVEIPSQPQAMPRNVTLLLEDGRRVICPFLSQGGYLTPSGLDRLAVYVRELGLDSVPTSGPAIPPFPRFMRNIGASDTRSRL